MGVPLRVRLSAHTAQALAAGPVSAPILNEISKAMAITSATTASFQLVVIMLEVYKLPVLPLRVTLR
jgi:hypothetical protein